jgi:hypothetical protein
MAATVTQRDLALKAATEQRMRISSIRRRARSGDLTLNELILDPPDELAHMPCVDVVRLTLRSHHSTAGLQRLGRLAVRDGINLLMPVGGTSARTRAWIAEHADWHRPAPNGGQTVKLAAIDG